MTYMVDLCMVGIPTLHPHHWCEFADDEEGDDGGEEDDPTIFKTLLIKVVPVNSRDIV